MEQAIETMQNEMKEARDRLVAVEEAVEEVVLTHGPRPNSPRLNKQS